MAEGALRFDGSRRADLGGTWDFFPGDHAVADLSRIEPVPIVVPGLWEAQGHLDLDGVAWYRHRFRLDNTDDDNTGGYWTLHFGAVMDTCDVFLNGRRLGGNDLPFTPFDLDATALLVCGSNELAVRVNDPPRYDPQHRLLPHGKQGWANEVFPSPPSLYMTYGGIWQPVSLRRHGPLVVGGVFVNGDPDALNVRVDVDNRGGEEVDGSVCVRTLGVLHETPLQVPAGGRVSVEVSVGAVEAERWCPQDPVLHDVMVDVRAGGGLSDSTTTRYGLRTIGIEGRRLMLNGKPYRMKSVLVQGFCADRLYAEGTRDQIREEVSAARAMGFNALRLHIKAFEPAYLDVCDETGMLVHCDLPVAEPVDHEQMGGSGTELGRRCEAAARAQVRRDRNHPAIVAWSAMNEIGIDRVEVRQRDSYEDFVRTLVTAVQAEDGTRPVIENDWFEPDPDRVFVSPVLTAHWYGRLHRDYLDQLEAACERWSGLDRPLLVTEFGDWGLPHMPELAEPPFWDVRAVYAAALAETPWPATLGRFVVGSQRYQGLSDRFQAEVFRRHDHIGGYCLTELTDVPFELNGLLDLHRRPKEPAAAEMARANQVVLPMLAFDSLVVAAGGVLRAPLHVANDGPALDDVTVEVGFAKVDPGAGIRLRLGAVPGATVTAAGEVEVSVPEVPGGHDLVLRLLSAGLAVAENRYPVHVVDPAEGGCGVRLLGSEAAVAATRAALVRIDAVEVDGGLTVVAEDGLDADTAAEVQARLAHGEAVVLLAQRRDAAPLFPVPVALEDLATAWGSTDFRLTTDHGAIPSLPRRSVLVAEDATVQATAVVAGIDAQPFPDTPVVVAYKPVPAALTGTVLGAHAVGPGRLVFCQYRLAARSATGDAAACALLGDVLRWAARSRPVLAVQTVVKPDGRHLHCYSWDEATAR